MLKRRNYAFAAIYFAVILFVAITYRSVIHAEFIWDDVLDLRDSTWLRIGNEWQHYIFRDYHYWTNYFRPLGVGLLTLQVRFFDGAPGPMHAISLAMHLINTSLVGVLSWCFLVRTDSARNDRAKLLIAVTMLIYGLHPLLIEPVAWISSQFDLLLTMLVMLGLILSISIRSIHARAAAVAILFFLAACTKEVAFSYPLIIVIFDWLIMDKSLAGNAGHNVRLLIARNWLVYLATFLAGLAYLGFRYWALGKIVKPVIISDVSAFGRFQEVCFLYVHYWKMLIWPMTGLNPLHSTDALQFNKVSIRSLLTDFAMVCIVLVGVRLALTKWVWVGCMILAVTAALLPVLHIIPVDFDNSLFHERYAIVALTVACPFIPLFLSRPNKFEILGNLKLPVLATSLLFWLVFALANVRATLPLWANNVSLWRWAVTENPGDIEAKNSLLAAYIDSYDYGSAHRYIETLFAEKVRCDHCMLNAAFLYIAEGNIEAATRALDQVKGSKIIRVDKLLFASYLLATGELLTLKGNFFDAESVLRVAVGLDTQDPEPQISLALALAYAGKMDEAKQIGYAAIARLPAVNVSSRRKAFEHAMSSGRPDKTRIDSN